PRASGAPGLTDWTYASTMSAAPSALCSKVIAPKEALPPVAGGVQAAFGICAANRSGGGPISSSRTTPASIEPIKHRIIPRPPFAAILFHFDPNWLDHRNTVDLQRCLEQIHRTAGYRRDGSCTTQRSSLDRVFATGQPKPVQAVPGRSHRNCRLGGTANWCDRQKQSIDNRRLVIPVDNLRRDFDTCEQRQLDGNVPSGHGHRDDRWPAKCRSSGRQELLRRS